MGVNPSNPMDLPWTIELTIDLPQKARWLDIYFEKIERMNPTLNAIGRFNCNSTRISKKYIPVVNL